MEVALGLWFVSDLGGGFGGEGGPEMWDDIGQARSQGGFVPRRQEPSQQFADRAGFVHDSAILY